MDAVMDGGLGLPALGLATCIQADNGSHRGSLPALPSRKDIGSCTVWQTGRDFPVEGQAAGWVRMAKNQSQMELGWGWSQGGRGWEETPPASGRRRGGNDKYVCSCRTKPGCIYRGVARPRCHHSVPRLQRAPRSWGPMWVLSGDGGPPTQRGHPPRPAAGPPLSSRLGPPSRGLLRPGWV